MTCLTSVPEYVRTVVLVVVAQPAMAEIVINTHDSNMESAQVKLGLHWFILKIDIGETGAGWHLAHRVNISRWMVAEVGSE
jgi:hypothetical protein